jgi:hypothetical protein
MLVMFDQRPTLGLEAGMSKLTTLQEAVASIPSGSHVAWIMEPRWGNTEQARASKRTIVIAEKIASGEVIRQNAERTVIPSLLISHVVELPFAAHPTSVYRAYDYDAGQIQRYFEATRIPEDFQAYIDRYIFEVRPRWIP